LLALPNPVSGALPDTMESKELSTMASEKQIAANRLNAQKSTGPRTPEGKAIAGQNALKHGVRSESFIQGFSDKEEYYELCAKLVDEWQPATPTEEHLLERMAIALWKAAYLDCLEGEELGPFTEHKYLGVIWQQQVRVERSYDKALSELRALQKDRAAHAAKPQPHPGPGLEPQPAVTADRPASESPESELIMQPGVPLPEMPGVPQEQPFTPSPHAP
jgi:hypothetical protein